MQNAKYSVHILYVLCEQWLTIQRAATADTELEEYGVKS
jgi:hypothetical protein